MIRYVIKRILWLIPVILCVSLIIYALMDMAPGNVVDQMINETTTPEQIEALREQFNLDKPMIYRYGLYMWGLLQGDLGQSQVTGLSVFNQFMSRFPNTLLLAFVGTILGIAIAIPLGIFAAKRAGSVWDNIATTFSMVGLSMPGFWIALLLIIVFSDKIKLFPAYGFSGWKSIVLPAVSCGLVVAAATMRQTRSSMLEVSKQDYLRTARAKGVSEQQVTRKHALGNAWIPIITTIGNTLSRVLAGSAVVEAVFSWPGVGRLTVDAVSQRDVTMACGCVILTSILYVFVLLMVDLIFAAVDPRIKAQYVNRAKKRRKMVEG